MHVTINSFRILQKIIEKYHRNKEIPACEDVAVREFTMIENEICIKFHYEQGRSTQATRTFVKPSIADRGDHLVFDPTMTHGYNVHFLHSKIGEKRKAM